MIEEGRVFSLFFVLHPRVFKVQSFVTCVRHLRNPPLCDVCSINDREFLSTRQIRLYRRRDTTKNRDPDNRNITQCEGDEISTLLVNMIQEETLHTRSYDSLRGTLTFRMDEARVSSRKRAASDIASYHRDDFPETHAYRPRIDRESALPTVFISVACTSRH